MLDPDRFVDFEQSLDLIRAFRIQEVPTFIVLIPDERLLLYRDKGAFMNKPDAIIKLALKYVE